MSATSRRAELEQGLHAVRDRIDAACERVGRVDPPTLIVVTKFFPRRDLDLLLELGVSDIGESREQEATAKLADGGRPPVRVHFIGQLQTRKSGSVARWADVVHSVDRPKLVGALGRAAEATGREITALVQVDLGEGDEAGRGGAAPDDVPGLADEVAASPLRLGGVMAVAPRGSDAQQADAAFARLADLSAAVRARHPHAEMLSAGMSGDLEQAVAHGATHLRVGTAILGSRPAPE